MTRRRWVAALLAATTAMSGLAAAPAVAATPAVTLLVAPDGGGIVRTDRPVSVTVRVTNSGEAALPAGALAFSLDAQPVASSTALLQTFAAPPDVLLGQAIPDTKADVPALAVGETATVRATITADDLAATLTSASGARILYARYRSGAEQEVAVSTLVRMAKGFDGSVGLGTVVPLLAPAGATGVVDTATQQALADPGGAWDQALRSAEAAPWATVALDPAVLASIRLAGDAAPPSAQQLLERLQRLPNEFVELPYADGDVTLERAAGLASVLRPTSFAGTSVVADPAGTPTDAPAPTSTPGAASTSVTDLTAWDWSDLDVAWPVPGTTTAADVAALSSAGDTLLLASTDVRDSTARRAAGPLARLGTGTARALVADATASGLLATAAGQGTEADAALAGLAALLATEAVTDDTAALLAVAGRAGDQGGLDRALSLLGRQSWVAGDRLGDLAAAGTAPRVALKAGSTPTDRVATARALIAGERVVRSIGSAVPSGAAAFTGPQRLALLGELSAAWRGKDAEWISSARAVQQGFSGLASAVAIAPQSSGASTNAIGTDGRLQVIVQNDLDVPVEVVVHASVSNNRLQFSGKGVPVVVPANGSGQARLSFSAITNGTTEVGLRLTTSSGVQLGRTVERRVNVQAGFDTIVAVVLLGALALLLALGVYRNVTRRRHPRPAPTA